MSATQPPLNAPEIRRLEPGHTYASVTDKIAAVVLTRPLGIGWLAGFMLAFSLVMLLFGSLAWLIVKGVGIWDGRRWGENSAENLFRRRFRGKFSSGVVRFYAACDFNTLKISRLYWRAACTRKAVGEASRGSL
jgi:hypothetical protein